MIDVLFYIWLGKSGFCWVGMCLIVWKQSWEDQCHRYFSSFGCKET